MRLKSGVRIGGLHGEAIVALMITNALAESRGFELVVTSCCEGAHSTGSRHYMGQAFDVRVSTIPESMRANFRNELADRLGADFDVVLENDHIHVEFDPKKGMNL